MKATGTGRRRLIDLGTERIAILLAFASSVASLVAESNANPRAVRGGQKEIDAQVSGHVYRADTGAPLAGAVVTLRPCYVAGSMWVLTATTAADGSYTVSVRPFCYLASASSPGFVPQPPGGTPFNLKPGDKVDSVDFHLPVAAIISGSVFDGTSQPVAHLNVSAHRRRFEVGGKSHSPALQLVMTDDQGHFRLDALPSGDYFVCADAAHKTAGATGPAPGWTYHLRCFPSAPSVDEAQPVHAIPGKETSGIRFQITADKTYNIVAEPQDPGAGTAGRSYDLNIPHGAWASEGHGNVTTIPQVFPGTYTLVMLSRDESRQRVAGVGSRTIQVIDSDVHVTIPIGRLGEVRGRAIMPSSPGTSLSGVEMVLGSRFALDAGGNFAIQVTPGPQNLRLFPKNEKMYLKQVRCSGRDYTTEPLIIKHGQVVSDCEVTLAADAAVVKGFVSNGNKPATGISVVIIPQSVALRKIARYTLATTTDTSGHFQVEGVIPGDYFLFAVPSDIDAPYYALDFPDRHQNEAQSISVKPNETRLVSPILTIPQ